MPSNLKTETSNITIVILAAGASTRMGSPKQLLKWGNTTLLGNTIEKAKNTSAKEVVVVLGANYQLVNHSIKQSKVTILNNKNWRKGLGSSIAFAIDYILQTNTETNGVLIMLADQPFIEVDFLESIINQFQKGEKPILATAYNNNKLGVPAIFDSIFFKELLKLTGDKGAKDILIKYKSNIKVLIPPIKNVDLDFKEDYLIFKKTYFKK